jgi:hypothetical protein
MSLARDGKLTLGRFNCNSEHNEAWRLQRSVPPLDRHAEARAEGGSASA